MLINIEQTLSNHCLGFARIHTFKIVSKMSSNLALIFESQGEIGHWTQGVMEPKRCQSQPKRAPKSNTWSPGIPKGHQGSLNRAKKMPKRAQEHPKEGQLEPKSCLKGRLGRPWEPPRCPRNARGSPNPNLRPTNP